MKVADYIRSGLKNFVEGESEGTSGTCTEGCHRVTVFLKKEGDRITDCRFSATKKYKKLLAVTDYMCSLVKEKGKPPDPEEILNFFGEEKEREKMENRVSIALRALEAALEKLSS